MLRMRPAGRASVLGFTLVELMVTMVVMLVISLAAITFIVAIAKANTEDIRVTRLNQEVRSVSEVITREIKRARFLRNTVDYVGTGGLTANDTITITPQAVNSRYCISFSYDALDTDTAANCPTTTANPSPLTGTRQVCQRSFWLDRSSGIGVVRMTTNLTCSGGTALTSPQVDITSLTFDIDQAGTLPTSSVTAALFIRSAVAGSLASEPAVSSVSSVSRRFTQDIYIRSGLVN